MVLSLLNVITNLQNETLTIANAFKNKVLTQTIPQGITDLHSLAGGSLNTLRNATACQWAANDLLGTINSICIETV